MGVVSFVLGSFSSLQIFAIGGVLISDQFILKDLTFYEFLKFTLGVHFRM